MRSLDLIPKGSPVLLTVPVIIYGIFGTKATHSMPLSQQCNRLLDSCRTNYYSGIITSAIVSRCWEILERVRNGVSNLEEEADAGYFAQGIKSPIRNTLPKRINGLVFGELELAPVDRLAFENAADLVRLSSIPVPMALDIAAASIIAPHPLVVALANEPKWTPVPNHHFHCADDLPWHVAARPPVSSEPRTFYVEGSLKMKDRPPPKPPRPKRIRLRRRRRKRGSLSAGNEYPSRPGFFPVHEKGSE
jgi:hypothetical protein